MSREEMLNECISRDRAIVQLNHLKSDWDDDWNVAICKCIETIKKLPSVTPMQKWIPVSEGLPEEAGMYLCSYDDDYVGTSYFDIRMNEFNTFHEQVTAWMYIPEPYQSEIPTVAEGSEE